jgi:hypothetical protein
MVKLTENKVAEIDTSGLEKRAQDIREAVITKSVTVEMVGSLFADLIEACGNVRDALALFLDTNVGEITSDIDTRLADADAATKAANAATQKTEATRTLVENLVSVLSSQNVSAPTRLEITDYPKEVTLGNRELPRIEAKALPAFGIGSLLFIGGDGVLEVTPDGRITPLKEGVGRVNVVATVKTSIYKTLSIAVVPPRIRLTGTGIRLDGSGNIRLT